MYNVFHNFLMNIVNLKVTLHRNCDHPAQRSPVVGSTFPDNFFIYLFLIEQRNVQLRMQILGVCC